MFLYSNRHGTRVWRSSPTEVIDRQTDNIKKRESHLNGLVQNEKFQSKKNLHTCKGADSHEFRLGINPFEYFIP